MTMSRSTQANLVHLVQGCPTEHKEALWQSLLLLLTMSWKGQELTRKKLWSMHRGAINRDGNGGEGKYQEVDFGAEGWIRLPGEMELEQGLKDRLSVSHKDHRRPMASVSLSEPSLAFCP